MNGEQLEIIISKLKTAAFEQHQFLETNTDWSHPATEAVVIAQELVFTKLAEIFSSL